MRARELLGPNGPFARDPGYELRPSQLDMADAVERALADDRTLIVEAGTGTGKTLAYLIPAIESGRKIIVSTGTRALQDQIMEHDIPLLEKRLGRTLRVACMKGLSNYLCLRRFEEWRRTPESATGMSARHLPMIEDWRATTFSGDRSELDSVPEDSPIWAHVTSGSDTRIGSTCRFYEECFVTRMRREAEQAELIVVNHHLFFADLAVRGPHGAGVLPDYSAVIFDEAHQIEDAATSFFGTSVSSARIERLARDAERALVTGERDRNAIETATRLTQFVVRMAHAFFDSLPLGAEGVRMELPRDAISGESERAFFALDDALAALAAHAELRASRHEAIMQIGKRAVQLREDCAAIAEGSRGKRVAWGQRAQRGATIGASPIDVGDLLRAQLFERTPAVVLTSATLSTAGNFDYLRQRLGIDAADQLILPSPFDYPMQAALYLVRDLPDPRDPSFEDRGFAEIERLVGLTGGGAFVLCTSLRRMRAFAAMARAKIALPILVQNEMPKQALLERFRASGESVLFATSSFWEGVDVPGHALRLVVIEKLPFDVPTDPLVSARCERLREKGEAPFAKYLLPSAAIALKQGFGRLIRARSDRGIVAVLDSRIVTKSYGRVLLASLPDASRCHSFEEVRAFALAANLFGPIVSPEPSVVEVALD
jgi:ATP-dependent DNA helicase DinG